MHSSLNPTNRNLTDERCKLSQQTRAKRGAMFASEHRPSFGSCLLSRCSGRHIRDHIHLLGVCTHIIRILGPHSNPQLGAALIG